MTKLLTILACASVLAVSASAVRADHLVGAANRSSGGSAPAPSSSPAYISTYTGPAFSVPAYSQGNYVVPNYAGTPNFSVTSQMPNFSVAPLSLTQPIYSGAFVPPPIIYTPSFTPRNYFLPGDFYARSTYYVPNSVSPIVTYPAPATLNNNMVLHAGGPPSGLSFTPMNRK